MNKEQLTQLAKVARYDTCYGGFVYYPESCGDRVKDWQPHKNIAQALEVLEGWRKRDEENQAAIKLHAEGYGGHYSVMLSTSDRGVNKLHSLPEAICEAVLRAEGVTE